MPTPGTSRPGAAFDEPMPAEFAAEVRQQARLVLAAAQSLHGPIQRSPINAGRIWAALGTWAADARLQEIAPTHKRLLTELQALRVLAKEGRWPANEVSFAVDQLSFACADALLGCYPVPTERLIRYAGPTDDVAGYGGLDLTYEVAGYDWLDPRSGSKPAGAEEIDVELRRLERATHLLGIVPLPDLHQAGIALFSMRRGDRHWVMPDLASLILATRRHWPGDDLVTFLDLVVKQVSLLLGPDPSLSGSSRVGRRIQPPPAWHLRRVLFEELWPDFRIRPMRAAESALVTAADLCAGAFSQLRGGDALHAYNRGKDVISDRPQGDLLTLCHQNRVAEMVDDLLLERDCEKRSKRILGKVGFWRAELALRVDAGVYTVKNAKISRWPARGTLPKLGIDPARRTDPDHLLDEVERSLAAWDDHEGILPIRDYDAAEAE
ncbi:hypothetical protein VQ042_09870 [Aurantimonas sp. A2-1-M11]|uniref:hypothetical protein n=1 Tax=Aurantimonas sp. A2-1-M11 TaxID=3113712 RepID=UPI002F9477D5